MPPISLATALTLTQFKTGGFYYAVISDIHLGHNRNPAARIVENLFTAFPDNAETASLDAIFIAGDVFDNILMFNDEDIDAIKHWVNSLLHLCKKHVIKLRVLEGTPLHDRTQSRYFPMENEIGVIGADLKYIDKIDIEYIEDLDVHVLYIPDEPPGGSGPALQTVKDLMRARGIEQVDMAIIHGLFRFQIEYVDSSITHDEQEYLRLVKHNISVGHDHTHKSFEQDGHGIYVQGSFDRLGHGYETPKGHMRFKWQPDGTWQIRFIENTNAMQFITLNCTGKTLEETFEYVGAEISKVPDGSHIRILAESNHPVFANMEVLIRMGPLLNWKKEPVRDKEKALAPLAEVDTKYIPINITPDNLVSLLLEKIASEGASGEVMDVSLEMLEELFPCKKPSSITQTRQMAVP
jgi:hypothetical protein